MDGHILGDARVGARSRGVTLVEVLVVISLVGVLVSLLLPAVQRSRDSARRMMCANQMRQIAIGIHTHADTVSVVPHNGGWDGKQTIPDRDGAEFTPSTTDLGLSKTFLWGVGDPSRLADVQTGSWLYTILPFVEHEAIYHARQMEAPVPIYVCPGRRIPVALVPVGNDQYGSYNGGGLRWCKTDYAGNALVMPGRPNRPAERAIALADIGDGLSCTILAGEKACDPSIQTPESWYWDEPFFLGGSSGTVRSGLGVVPDSFGADFKDNWGSPHASGCVFALCDGSVRTVSYECAWATMSALLTPSGGELHPEL